MKSERVPHPPIQISSCIPPGWQHPHRRIQNSKFSFKFCRLKTLGSQRPPVGAPNRRQSIPRFDASKFPQFDVRPIAPRKSQIDNVGSTNCKPPAPHHSHGHGCAPVACARFVLGHFCVSNISDKTFAPVPVSNCCRNQGNCNKPSGWRSASSPRGWDAPVTCHRVQIKKMWKFEVPGTTDGAKPHCKLLASRCNGL